LHLADIISKKFSLPHVEVKYQSIDINISLSIGVAVKTSKLTYDFSFYTLISYT
jgi:hypothetical protein